MNSVCAAQSDEEMRRDTAFCGFRMLLGLFRLLQGFMSASNPVEVREVTQDNDPVDGIWRELSDVSFRSGRGGHGGEGKDDNDFGRSKGGEGRKAADDEILRRVLNPREA